MKKIVLLVSVMILSFATASFAAEKKSYSRAYGMAGCGLGSMIVGKKGGQIFAATTNSTVYNQLFGITFGTLGCEDEPNSEVAHRMDNFVAANKVALASDIARGGGDTVSSLGTMMGCTGDVGASMQKSFRSIFPDTSVAPNEITDSIISVIRQDSALGCKQIS